MSESISNEPSRGSRPVSTLRLAAQRTLGSGGLAATVALLVLLAWRLRFVQDDAFIIFRYAENLSEGQGLVWNPGERIEGYTTYLWTLLMALGARLEVAPTSWAYALGLSCFAATLRITYALVRRALDSRQAAWGTVVLLGTNFSFSAYATGGLETALQACLFTLAVTLWAAIWARPDRGPQPVALSLTLAAALLTRLDAAIIAATLVPTALWAILADRRARTARARLWRAAGLLLPCTALVGAWLIWKVSYYGDLLPNTFYAKVATGTSLTGGLYYVYLFLASYWLMPLVFVGLSKLPRLWSSAPPVIRMAAGTTVAWVAYVVSVGGDFMEFRFIVPVLPLAFAWLGWLLYVELSPGAVRAALVATVLLGSVHHAVLFDRFVYRRGVETVDQLARHLDQPRENWAGIGRRLRAAFPEPSQVRIAVFPAGAIPYYSRLESIDMFGLNDRWVARYGDIVDGKPGHRRRAPLAYLVAREAHLVVGDPWVRPAGRGRRRYRVGDLAQLGLDRIGPGELPAHASMVEMPIGQGHTVTLLYLTPLAEIDRALAVAGWPVRAIEND